MSHTVIRIENLWKQYRLGTINHGTLKADLSSWWARVRGRDDPNLSLDAPRPASMQFGEHHPDRFWALKDINLEVTQGDVLGLIGKNGAGKSTLLKILSRVTAPTRGRVKVKGRIASLLEVGTGFHPELTGRENIFLNGAILGMKRGEVSRKLDDIVAFAEVEQFVDTPVKRYSSGMYVRLAFAVAAHLDADVLVIDEVLAVGDSTFQDKCLDKMGEVSTSGRTVLFVSHNLGAISRLCSRAVVLDYGELHCDGGTSDALVHYSAITQHSGRRRAEACTGPLVGKVDLQTVTLNRSEQAIGQIIRPEVPISIVIGGTVKMRLRGFRVTVCVYKSHVHVIGMHDAEKPIDIDAGLFESEFTIPAFFLSPGQYTVDINVYSEGLGEWLIARSYLMFSISSEWHTLYEPTHGMGVVNLPVAGKRSFRT